jgi:hypothetical protein
MDKNLKWMQKGNLGCVFATYFSQNPEKCNWKRFINPTEMPDIKDSSSVSLVFENLDLSQTRDWALKNGFYEENINEDCIGLRLKLGDKVAWVQYFGQESHVKTRQSPFSELIFKSGNPIDSFHRVKTDDILHLAQMAINKSIKKFSESFWRKSFENTRKIIGHELGVKEAAKTTWLLTSIKKR